MKKSELLTLLDEELMEKLFGFCYVRTNDSYAARDLCSDIVWALVKTAGVQEDVEEPYAFIWRVARNVYADYSMKKRRHRERFYQGDADDVFAGIADEEIQDDDMQLLEAVYRCIAFLTRAYREVMILYYLDGCSTAQIAKLQHTSETAVRQRLFSARQKVKSEVENMIKTKNRPVVLDKIDYRILGNGEPDWGDPSGFCKRQLSRHIVWLCRKKNMSTAAVAEQLHVPTVYVEEELEILAKGANGQYGLLRRLDNGRYTTNFVLLDKDEMAQVRAVYEEQLMQICDVIEAFVRENREEYLAFPYINRKPEWNLILWQQLRPLTDAFPDSVKDELRARYFAGIEESARPYSVFGFVYDGKDYGCGWNSMSASNICGYSKVFFSNIAIKRIKAHLYWGGDMANDLTFQMGLRAIDGLAVNTLSESEREHAARAIECGYLYREDNMLYTKFLVSEMKDIERLFDITKRLQHGYFDEAVRKTAEKMARLIEKILPEHLLGDWRFVNDLASLPMIDAIVEELIARGVLVPPEDGIGAEGCWASVEK